MEITTPGTEITSPGYPNEYANNIQCNYAIRFNDGQRITLRFLHFDLYHPKVGTYMPSVHILNTWNKEQAISEVEITVFLWLLFSVSNQHSLAIWDGKDMDGTFMGHKFKSELPKPFTSSNKELFLRFQSGSHGKGTGYRIRIELSKLLISYSIIYMIHNTWPTKRISKSQNSYAFTETISCGQKWRASVCSDCPTINGTTSCNGDCYLDQDTNMCKQKRIVYFW